MRHNGTHSELDAFVEALVDWAGMGSVMIDHMARWSEGRATPESVRSSMTSVLDSALASLRGTLPARDLATATTVMARAMKAVEDEVLLVDPSYEDRD